MKAVQAVLSPEAALIAEKIPQITPLLRMIEEAGFQVAGYEATSMAAKPVHILGTAPGSLALKRLLEKRGYQIALSDPPEKTGTVREAAEPAFRKAVSV